MARWVARKGSTGDRPTGCVHMNISMRGTLSSSHVFADWFGRILRCTGAFGTTYRVTYREITSYVACIMLREAGLRRAALGLTRVAHAGRYQWASAYTKCTEGTTLNYAIVASRA